MVTVLMIIKLLALTISLSSLGHAHQAHKHSSTSPNEDRLKEFKVIYQRDIQPIFQQKCMDCHSRKTTYPWYYKLPLAQQLIDYDIREAKSHMDMTDGFPFLSHGNPREDLESILEVIDENEMPPWRYRVLHSESQLTDAEKEKIKEWAAAGVTSLK